MKEKTGNIHNHI